MRAALYSLTAMNITRRRGTIALFITLGVCLVGLLVTQTVGWILLNGRELVWLTLGIVFFGLLIAGVVLNTVFLVREVRRNERQDSFLNAVTHELKTPIASIRLYLETLQRRAVTDEKRQEFYRIMLSDSDRLLATVDQVLKAAEASHRKQKNLHRILVDMEPLVAECVMITLQRHHLPAEAIRLREVPGAVSLRVQGSPEDLRTAILNLLENAVKYSSGEVNVECELSILDYDRVVLTVRDTGIGVAPGDLKNIFKRFYRAQDVALRQVKGTGLGLFIVRSIARQHGGNATAESEGPGQGTTMRIELPLAAASAAR